MNTDRALFPQYAQLLKFYAPFSASRTTYIPTLRSQSYMIYFKIHIKEEMIFNVERELSHIDVKRAKLHNIIVI